MWCKYVVFVLFLALSQSWADNVEKSDKSDNNQSLVKDCERSYSATCLKLAIVSWVDTLSEDDNLSVLPGVSIVRENSTGVTPNTGDIVADLARDFPNDPDARLDAFLLRKVQGYLGSHSIKVNLYGEDDATTGRQGGGAGVGALGGGRGRRKRGNGLQMLLAAAAMMKGTLMALAMGALAALAGKALMTGLISLLLSAIIGIKSLTSGSGKTTYEVVSKPVYSHAPSQSVSHEDWHSGHGRSFDLPLPLGLQPGYKPVP